MADIRPDLTEGDIRSTHDHLMEIIQEQRRAAGVPVPDDTTARSEADKVIKQIVNDRPEEQKADRYRPEKVETTRTMQDGSEMFQQEIGTVELDTNGNMIGMSPELQAMAMRDAMMPPTIKKAVHRVRDLLKIPAWRKRLMDIINSNIPTDVKDEKYKKLLMDSVEAFGKLGKQIKTEELIVCKDSPRLD